MIDFISVNFAVPLALLCTVHNANFLCHLFVMGSLLLLATAVLAGVGFLWRLIILLAAKLQVYLIMDTAFQVESCIVKDVLTRF